MAKWFEAAKRADFQAIGEKYHISPVLARIIRNRDITEEKDIDLYLHGTLEQLHNPHLMKDMDKAVEVLLFKIQERKKLRIIGDYDVDGICSAYILKRGISLCGGEVDTVIPHRMKDGYGINEQLIREACEDGVDTIITCDNGIAAASQLAYAASLGMTCIVTDHHEVPYEIEGEEKRYLLPAAAAVVNPKQADCPYPYPQICGAVVAWKLITCLWEHFEAGAENRRELLELAGFATVCDVMELLNENRIIVKEALKSMQNSANLGLRSLIRVHELNTGKISAYHVGFMLGPCFNAAGRLDTAARALELLDCKNEREAIRLAAELKQLNESSKSMTEAGEKEAVRTIEEQGLDKDKVMVVFLPDCHESLAGIIAGRIREKYYKPTFILTRGEEEIKGSGRSIEGYHMHAELIKCKELFSVFGGHEMAAGLSLPQKNVDIFRRKLNENCSLTEEELEEKILIDVALPLSYVTRGFLQELNLLEPFGPGNAKPVFARKNLKFVSMRIMGAGKNMGKFIIEEDGQRYQAVLFRHLEIFLADIGKKYGETVCREFQSGTQTEDIKMDIIYYPSLNEYMGRQEIQFVIQNWK